LAFTSLPAANELLRNARCYIEILPLLMIVGAALRGVPHLQNRRLGSASGGFFVVYLFALPRFAPLERAFFGTYTCVWALRCEAGNAIVRPKSKSALSLSTKRGNKTDHV